jgi:hypothetical protein
MEKIYRDGELLSIVHAGKQAHLQGERRTIMKKRSSMLRRLIAWLMAPSVAPSTPSARHWADLPTYHPDCAGCP